MDVLACADVEGAVGQAVFFVVSDLLNLEVDLLFFDKTSTYFEIEEEDEASEGEGDIDPLRRFGHSKDPAPTAPRSWSVGRGRGSPCGPGLARQHRRSGMVERVKATSRGGGSAERCRSSTAASSEDNLRYLRRGAGLWIAGQRTSSSGIERLRERGQGRIAHERAECALRDHPSHSRYLSQLASERLRIDRAEVAAEDRLDGKFLLGTSAPDISAQDAALGYKNVLEGERSFCSRPSAHSATSRARCGSAPVFHRLKEHFRAHMQICWLALLLIRIAERETGETWRRLRSELEQLKLVTLAGSGGHGMPDHPLGDRLSGQS